VRASEGCCVCHLILGRSHAIIKYELIQSLKCRNFGSGDVPLARRPNSEQERRFGGY
jgi:hypothetical protein